MCSKVEDFVVSISEQLPGVRKRHISEPGVYSLCCGKQVDPREHGTVHRLPHTLQLLDWCTFGHRCVGYRRFLFSFLERGILQFLHGSSGGKQFDHSTVFRPLFPPESLSSGTGIKHHSSSKLPFVKETVFFFKTDNGAAWAF